MAQLYLLSVVSLVFGGLLAASGFISRRVPALAGIADFAEHRSLVLTTGIVSILVGVLKLFVRAPGDTVPVAGDLLPAIAGIVVGLVLVLGQTSSGETGGGEAVQQGRQALLTYRDPIGLAAVLIGILHFLFPAVVLL